MVGFLNEHFENDDMKDHFLVDAEKMSEIRKKEHGTLNIKGSRKMHLIAVNPAGTFFTMEHYKDEDFVTNLSLIATSIMMLIMMKRMKEDERG